jgi:uncharacterized protein (TIGR03118 family)
MAARHLLLATLLTASLPAMAAETVTQTNLVSDGAIAAAVTDPNLKNPWGISFGPGGPFWVSDNANGLTTLYNTEGAVQPLVVTIPPAAGVSGPGSPTGQVFNPTKGFVVSAGSKSAPAVFIFATEDGTISAWSFTVNPASAVVMVDRSREHAVYKGLALYTDVNGNTYLLATDFRAGLVDVFDSSFHLVKSFRDPAISRAYAPYNVAVLNGNIFVTYAHVDAARHDSTAGPRQGAVEEVSLAGEVLLRAERGNLDAPWGMAVAPFGFGRYAGDILVGNFGSGTVAAFSPSLEPHGVLRAPDGTPLVIDGLWALIPGNGRSGGDLHTVYFSAGPNNETDGLLGALTITR